MRIKKTNKTRNILIKKRLEPFCSFRFNSKNTYINEEQSTTMDLELTKKNNTTRNAASKKITFICNSNKNNTNKTFDILYPFCPLHKPVKIYKIGPRPPLLKLSSNPNYKYHYTSYQKQIKPIAPKLLNYIDNNNKIRKEMSDSIDQSSLNRKISDRALSRNIKRALSNYIEYDLPDIDHYPSIQHKLMNYSYTNEMNHLPTMINHLNKNKDDFIFEKSSIIYNVDNKEISSLNNTLLSSQSRLVKLCLTKKEYDKIEKVIPYDVQLENALIYEQYFEQKRCREYVIKPTYLKIKNIIFNNELWQ